MVINKNYNNIYIYKVFIIINLLINIIDKDYFKSIKNNFLNQKEKIKNTEPILKIFIITHRDFQNNRHNPVYNIVADDKSQLKNNYTNISIIYANEGKLYNKRRAYCEMSKIYYIYQLYKTGKISSKYIGFNHYRRYFNFTDNIPNIDDIFKEYEIILNGAGYLPEGIRQQYCNYHICEKYDEILNIIKDIKPDYYKSALETSNKTKVYFCNLFIMKKEDFFKYCEFMFDILFEFDRRNNFSSDNDVLNYTKKIYNDSNMSNRQSRLQAFLSERISNIFFNKNFKKVISF